MLGDGARRQKCVAALWQDSFECDVKMQWMRETSGCVPVPVNHTLKLTHCITQAVGKWETQPVSLLSATLLAERLTFWPVWCKCGI
jgi:hypothetical protein